MHPDEKTTIPESTTDITVETPAANEATELRLNAHDTVADLVPQASIPRSTPSYKDVGWRKWL